MRRPRSWLSRWLSQRYRGRQGLRIGLRTAGQPVRVAQRHVPIAASTHVLGPRDVASRRPEFAACKRMTWEAVRLDLLSNQAALRELRGALGDIDCALASEASAKLSDLRLLDMLAWAAEVLPR